MNKRQRAKSLLKHYLVMALGNNVDLDVRNEIEDIVDLIVEAAIEEVEKRHGVDR